MIRYRKALVGIGGVLAQIIALGLVDGTALAWLQVAAAAVTAALVYLVPNAPDTTPQPEAEQPL
jgi:hypothetical protein